MVEIPIRNWRVMEAEPSGLMLWFDPTCESIRLYHDPLALNSVVGPEENPGVDEKRDRGYLDKVGSVSASEQGKATDAGKRYEQVEVFKEDEDLPF